MFCERPVLSYLLEFCGMVLEDASNQDKRLLAGAFVVAIAVSAGIGFAAANILDSGSEVSSSELTDRVESVMDQQLSAQEQQALLVANQSDSVSEEDISLDADVGDISQADFASLYRVEASVTGTMINQAGNDTQSVDQSQVFYISGDGRYLFPEPTDLEQEPQQQQSAPQTQ